MTRLSIKINGKLGNFNINFEHDFVSNGITVLYGPNASGKSTIISSIGGFIDDLDIKVKLNNIILDGEIRVPSYKRPLGTMFQNPILFDHLTVNQNLNFAIKRSRKKFHHEKKIERKYLINNLELHPLLDRYPHNLSGGEKLRVSLARTLLTQPSYLLLDEPMSEIDIKNKAKLLFLLKKINKEFNVPILYVSHSIEEISQIADQIVLIDKGKKIKSGTIDKIINDKKFQSLIGRFETSSIIQGNVLEVDRKLNLTVLDVNGQDLVVPGKPGNKDKIVRVRIRSRDIIVSPLKINIPITENELRGVISNIEIEKQSAFSEVLIILNGKKNKLPLQTLRARMTTYNLKKMHLHKNSKIFIYISAVSIDRQAYQYQY